MYVCIFQLLIVDRCTYKYDYVCMYLCMYAWIEIIFRHLNNYKSYVIGKDNSNMQMMYVFMCVYVCMYGMYVFICAFQQSRDSE